MAGPEDTLWLPSVAPGAGPSCPAQPASGWSGLHCRTGLASRALASASEQRLDEHLLIQVCPPGSQVLSCQEGPATCQRDMVWEAQGTGQHRGSYVSRARPLGFETRRTNSTEKVTAFTIARNWFQVRTSDIWAAVFPCAPMRTMARAEEMLMGEINTFCELSSPRCFKRVKAKVPFASDRASMAASLKRWI